VVVPGVVLKARSSMRMISRFGLARAFMRFRYRSICEKLYWPLADSRSLHSQMTRIP